MPTLTAQRITDISYDLLHSAGTPEGYARTVAKHLADANLVGHDSHGFLRIIQYVNEIKDGIINPSVQPEVIGETSSTAQIDGHSLFGQVIGGLAIEVAIKKARNVGLSLVTITNHQHMGRVGAYPEEVAKQGMAAIMCTGFVGGSRLKNVAPFGGIRRKLGSNPIAMGFPYTETTPILLDFATSIAAEGKLRVARSKGELLPDDWVLTGEGVPTRDPNAYYDGGSLLPTGGLYGGHKGYALSFMVALFGGILSSLSNPLLHGSEVSDDVQRSGTTLIVIDLGVLGNVETLKSQVHEMVRYAKDTPLREGFDEVFYPGELEARTRLKRTASGIYIEDATWNEIVDLMNEYGVSDNE